MPPAHDCPLAVISPHLDDAVFSCGRLLAAHPGARVVTVFAGRPPPTQALREWDAAAGFAPGEDMIGARRAEDAAALAVLGAEPIWMDFRDAQYDDPPDPDALADGLEAALRALGAGAVFVPLGLFHSDHLLAHAAGVRALRCHPEWPAYLYADAIYRRYDDLLARRLAELSAAGYALTAASPPQSADLERKRRAVDCYASQLRALDTPGRPGVADLWEPEHYWRVRLP